MFIPEIFLYIAVGVLLIPSFCYLIYPHPKNFKLQKAELDEEHKKCVVRLENRIEVARKHHSGMRVFGGAEPWAQAERDELDLQDELHQENYKYNKRIKELEKFPLTNALVIFSIFLTSIGLYLTNLAAH